MLNFWRKKELYEELVPVPLDYVVYQAGVSSMTRHCYVAIIAMAGLWILVPNFIPDRIQHLLADDVWRLFFVIALLNRKGRYAFGVVPGETSILLPKRLLGHFYRLPARHGMIQLCLLASIATASILWLVWGDDYFMVFVCATVLIPFGIARGRKFYSSRTPGRRVVRFEV